MPTHPTESLFEAATIERLVRLGYRHQHGNDLDRPLHTVVLPDLLRAHLRRRYPHLPAEAVEQAIQVASAPEGVTLDRRNMAFQRLLRQGHILRYDQGGEERFEHIDFIDFERPDLNDFLVVSQLPIQAAAGGTGNSRRPDLVVYVNGLPLVVFELKRPWDEYADVGGAHNQLGHYTVDIPQLFNFNAFCVISDGNTTLHGMHSAGFEWFSPWKFIDSTIEKFRLREGERRHPVLSERRNILVIADEAHRTQYGLLDGFPAYLRQALPNASFLGFTGTPIDKEDANTVQLFGDYIHVYDMQQAKEDRAVVGLFYERRHIPLALANPEIDADLEEITEEQEGALEAGELEQAKAKWAAVERAAGTRKRLAVLGQDLLAHFNRRQQALQGKAMVVCMSRRNCVALYDALTALPNIPRRQHLSCFATNCTNFTNPLSLSCQFVQFVARNLSLLGDVEQQATDSRLRGVRAAHL